MQKRNDAKAAKIFDAIAGSKGFYTCPVAPAVRSVMNIPFTMATPELEKEFLKACDKRGLMQLKGHRSVGGIRASVYNAMPDEGVDALVALMKVRTQLQRCEGPHTPGRARAARGLCGETSCGVLTRACSHPSQEFQASH